MLRKYLLFCIVFFLPSFAHGQEFNTVLDPSEYIVNGSLKDIIPSSSDRAILKFSYRPYATTTAAEYYVYDVSIVPSVSRVNNNLSLGGYGFVYNSPDTDPSFRDWYVVCDSATIYTRVSSIPNWLLSSIQSELEKKNLGTVSQRKALINSFRSSPVQILDIDNFKKSILNALSPFLNIYLGIFLTLFVVDLMSKKSKDVIAESAKIQRRAERAQQRREMRTDPTAQIFEFRLANFSSIASGSVSDPSISRRKARRLFEDTAMEYAEYKKSRGWKY